MTPIVARATYGETLARYSKALSWLQSCGVRTQGRLEYYRLALAQLVEAYESKNDSLLKTRMPEFVDVLFEANEVIDIHRGFSNISVPGLGQRLQILAEGPYRRGQELPKSASIVARNTAFELVIASRLALGGLSVDLSRTEDVRLSVVTRTVFVECKRPSSQKQIITRLKEGIDQCNKHIAAGMKHRDAGLVAIDLSKIVNPDGSPIRRETDAHIEPTLVGLVDSFAKEYAPKLKFERKIIALVIRFSALMIDRETSGLTHAQQWGFTSNGEISALRTMLAETVKAAFDRGIKGSAAWA